MNSFFAQLEQHKGIVCAIILMAYLVLDKVSTLIHNVYVIRYRTEIDCALEVLIDKLPSEMYDKDGYGYYLQIVYYGTEGWEVYYTGFAISQTYKLTGVHKAPTLKKALESLLIAIDKLSPIK